MCYAPRELFVKTFFFGLMKESEDEDDSDEDDDNQSDEGEAMEDTDDEQVSLHIFSQIEKRNS